MTNIFANNLTLRFADSDLEHRFLWHFQEKYLAQTRIALLLGFLLYAAFGYLDNWIIPDYLQEAHLIRLIVCGIILLALGLSLIQSFHPFIPIAWAVVSISAFVGLQFIIINSERGALYFTALPMVLMFVYILIGLRFVQASAIGLFLLCCFEVGVFFFQETSLPLILNDNFYMISISIIDMFGCYVIERNRRVNFYQLEIIGEHTAELEEKNCELSLLNNEKVEFLGIAAHDLRSPLGSVLANAEWIAEEGTSKEEIKEMSKAIRQASQSMLNLINNLLDVSAMEEMEQNVSLQPLDANFFVNRVIASYQRQAMEKNILLLKEGNTQSDWVMADPQWLTQILENLISNAIKYSPPGKRVLVRCEANRVQVQDEGPGLTEEDHQHLFQKFSRLSAQPTGGESSIGLGLYIVHRAVTLLGGSIRCESEPDQGAAFILELVPAPAQTHSSLLIEDPTEDFDENFDGVPLEDSAEDFDPSSLIIED